MTTLPANYVTILQLKERFMKEKEREQKEREEEERRQKEEEERAQKEKEEEELRQQKLKEEEEAKSRKKYGVAVVRNRGRFDRLEFRPVVDRKVYRPVVDRRESPPVSVTECEGGEAEGKREEPEEEKRWKRKKKKLGKKRNNVRAEKEGVAVQVCQVSVEIASNALRRNGGGRRRAGVDRAISKNVEEIEPETRNLTINGEIESGDDRLSSGNVGAKDEIESKVGDLGMTGETKRGNNRWRRPNRRNGAAREENEQKGRDLEMNSETERGSGRWRRSNHRNTGAKEEIELKVRELKMDGETERGDRQRGPNSEGEKEPEVGVRTGEIEGGRDILWRQKVKNVGEDEFGPKVMDSLVKAESKIGNERLRRPIRSDYSCNRKPWGFKKDQWVSLAWVKKGEVSDGNATGVQFLEHSISGSTRVSLNATSPKSSGPRIVISGK